MKKLLSLLIAVLLFCGIASGAALCDGAPKTLLLTTCYRQIGWGERFSMGAVDDEGKLWTLSLDSWQDIPYEDEAFLNWAQTEAELACIGTLSQDTLADVKGLVLCVENRPAEPQPCADDAGTQESCAYRRAQDGSLETIVLGVSGDSVYENTDPTAQALYRLLRDCFPDVTDYDGEPLIAPAGFRPVPILSFCGCEGVALDTLTMNAYHDDCEEGRTEITPDISAAELAALTVTGKKSCEQTTGNTTTYVFTDADGNTLAAFTFYEGLLVREDGMYSVR